MRAANRHHFLVSGIILLSTAVCASVSNASPMTCNSIFEYKSTLEGRLKPTQDIRKEEPTHSLVEGMVIQMGGFIVKNPAFGADTQVPAGKFRVEHVNADGSVEVSRWEESNVRYERSAFKGSYLFDRTLAAKHIRIILYSPPQLTKGMIIEAGAFRYFDIDSNSRKQSSFGQFRVEDILADGSVILSRWEESYVLYATSKFRGKYLVEKNFTTENVARVFYDPKDAMTLKKGMILESSGFTSKHPAFGADKQVSAGKFRVEHVNADGSVEVSRWEESTVTYERSGFRGRYKFNRDMPLNQIVRVTYIPQQLQKGMIFEMGGFSAKHPAFGADKKVFAGTFRVERVNFDGSLEVSRWEESTVRYEQSGFRGLYSLSKDITENEVVNITYNPPKLRSGMVIKTGTFMSQNPAFGRSRPAMAGIFRVETVYGDGSLALSRWEESTVIYERSDFKGTYYTKPNPQFDQVIEVLRQ